MVALANDESRTLLGLPEDAERRHAVDLGLPPGTAGILLLGREASDEVHTAGKRLLAVNAWPREPHGGLAGGVVTLRDTTEL